MRQLKTKKETLDQFLKQKKKFEYVSENYPNTDFAMDANFKLELIQDILASIDNYLGRHYIKRKNGLLLLIDLKT